MVGERVELRLPELLQPPLDLGKRLRPDAVEAQTSIGRRAQSLDEEARARAASAEQAKDAAQDAEGEAVLKSREAEEARSDAERARAAAPTDARVEE